MDKFLTLSITGLCTAGIFAVAASGLVLTYTTTGIFNFAHGAISMLGAFAYWQVRVDWGWPAPLALAAVLLVAAPLLGAVIERGIMRGLTDAPEIVRLVVTISLLVALLGIGLWVWSPQEAHPLRLFFEGERVRMFDVNVTWHEMIALSLGIATALGLRLLLFRTRAGLDMRAAVDSRPLAMLNGARPDRSAMLAWAIGCSLAALAGILIGPLSSLSHLNLTLLIVNAYAAAVLGRLRSLPMTFVGAIVLGLVDSYAIGYIPTSNTYFSTFRFALPVVILFVALVVLRPQRLRAKTGLASREDIPMPSWWSALATSGCVVAAAVVVSELVSQADALRTAKIFGLAVIALSLVPLVGFGGQVSLCQMSFAGIGALVMAHHGHAGDPIALVYAALLCGAVGAVVALPALRLSGIYLALATGAFAVFLDRWVFTLDAFDLGPWRIKFFELGTVPVAPLDVPGVDPASRSAQMIVLSVAFALLFLVVVAVRRSRYGQRLLAMKDSPAACATIGMDVTRVKLGVFSLSAAMAGVGGALYAGTFGSVSPETFSFFESLPLLLLAVVGGIGTASGALFTGLVLGGQPIAAGVWAWLANLNRVLPGTMGVALGRNPNGAVRDVAARYRVLGEVRPVLVALLVWIAGATVLALRGSLTGWGYTYAMLLGLAVLPQVAELVAWRRKPVQAETPLEWVGIERPITAADIAYLDRSLALEAVAR